MSKKGENTNLSLFPFEQARESLNEEVSWRRWELSYQRACLALDSLEAAGYDSAPFLRDVLRSFDDIIFNNFQSDDAQGLLRAATIALNRASKSRRLKRLIRTRNATHSDPACMLLRRVVSEVERVFGDLRTLDLSNDESKALLKEKLIGVLLSILTAEKQALRRV